MSRAAQTIILTQIPRTQMNKFADNENKSEFIHNIIYSNVLLLFVCFKAESKAFTMHHYMPSLNQWPTAIDWIYWMHLLLILIYISIAFYRLNTEHWQPIIKLFMEFNLIVNSLQSKFVCRNSKFRSENGKLVNLRVVRPKQDWLESRKMFWFECWTGDKAFAVCSALGIPCARLHQLEWYLDTMSRDTI